MKFSAESGGITISLTDTSCIDIKIESMDEPSSRTELQGPLSPAVFNILLTLADGELHGYAIMREVEESTGVRMGPGTLYGALKKMLTQGLVVESVERPDPEMDDERRRYYQLSALGVKALNLELNRMRSAIRKAKGKKLVRPQPAT